MLPLAAPIDPMHCIFLGVIRRLFAAVLARRDLCSESQLRALELAIRKEIVWPSYIKRRFRSLTDLAKMKATELQHVLLILPALQSCLRRDVFHVLLALASAVWLLDSDFVSQQNVNDADALLRAVHSHLEGIFGKQVLTINAHLLLHLPRQVEAMGPLWACSSHAFESHIYALSRLIPKDSQRGYLKSVGTQWGQGLCFSGDGKDPGKVSCRQTTLLH